MKNVRSGGGCDRRDDLQRQHRASGLRQQQIKAARSFFFWTSDEIDWLAVELRVADHQAVRHGHAHPTVFDNVDRKPGFARCEIAVDLEIVVDATECCFNWRWWW